MSRFQSRFSIGATVACIVLSVIIAAEAQLAAKLIQNPCVNKQTCKECIQTQSCGWCMQPEHGDKPRCFQDSYTNICPEAYIYNPKTEQILRINRQLTKAGVSGSTSASASTEEITQISPQRVGLKLRINQVHDLAFHYSQTEDYPVDLYYLMDLSKSMEDDKEKLSALGDLLSATMRNITSNFRIGFGSFRDKVLMPYVSTIPKKLEHPCENCEAPYGYRNHMPLSTDTSTFASEVKKAAVSGNLDAPNGGCDAIMQAIACGQQIGWRENARRFLVYSSNAGFLCAADGKLGGVITPNDGECHLNSEGLYTHSVIQDYPSISQINHKVKQNAINVIFAVTANQHSDYRKLSYHIEGSSSGILSGDSSNVVDIVHEEYNKISLSIEMKDNATSHVKITYQSACLNGGPEIPTSKCDGLKVGNIVSFTARISVTSCPDDPRDWKQTIQIHPTGINESLIIDLEMLCSCPCEHPGSTGYQVNSPFCSGLGTKMCGICECDDMYFGKNCECSSMYIKHDDFGCRADNTTNIECSGRGICLCGICECARRTGNDIIYGKYCECDNFSCPRRMNMPCSGPDHGTCACGQCVCNPGWTGDSCNYRT